MKLRWPVVFVLFGLVPVLVGSPVWSAETLLKVQRFPANAARTPAWGEADPSAILVREGFEKSELTIQVGRFTQNTDPKYVRSGKASLRVDCPKGEHNATSKLDYSPPNLHREGEGRGPGSHPRVSVLPGRLPNRAVQRTQVVWLLWLGVPASRMTQSGRGRA